MGAQVAVDELPGAIGTDLGHTDWMQVTQERVDRFADATGDHQWIHVDTERAASGPFGGTIAHGYLTLSLVSALLPSLLTVTDMSMGVNYGTNKVRFPSPVPVGANIRARGQIIAVDDVAGGYQVTARITIEVEDSDKPACVAEVVSRYLR
ncbi:MAG: MaoC family dehydratase [Acidimicrobiia bacterium]|nr:MaoC family dehydratase [Acidimicrobiia bacterium]